MVCSHPRLVGLIYHFGGYFRQPALQPGRPAGGRARRFCKQRRKVCHSGAGEPGGSEPAEQSRGATPQRRRAALLPAPCFWLPAWLPGTVEIVGAAAAEQQYIALNSASTYHSKQGWQHCWSFAAAKRAREPGFFLPLSNIWE